MSKIVQLRKARATLAAAQAQLAALHDDPELKALQEFESELRALLAKHSRSLIDVNQILDENYKEPKAKTTTSASTSPATVKRTWINPHNNEKITATHGNHKTLNAWRDKWGKDAVASWKQPI